MFEKGFLPLYFRLYLKLKGDILLGYIEPGDKIPTIDELHNTYGMSHMTVRKSLELLKREGLINIQQGGGAYATEKAGINLIRFMSWQEIVSNFEYYEIQPLSHGWVNNNQRLEKIFNDGTGADNKAPFYKTELLMNDKLSPLNRGVSTYYSPKWLVDDIGESKFASEEFLYLLIEKWPAKEILNNIHPWVCDVEQAELLDLADGTPIFFSTYHCFDHSNKIYMLIDVFMSANTLSNRFVF